MQFIDVISLSINPEEYRVVMSEIEVNIWVKNENKPLGMLQNLSI
jgi:hypothetical protein